jgi:hypothetical protein
MKKIALLYSLQIVLTSVLFEGGTALTHAGDAIATNTVPKVIGPVVDGFQLSIGTTNDVFQISQEIDLEVQIKNISTNTRPIKVQDSLMNYEFKIIGPNGFKTVPTELGERVLHPVSLYHQSGQYLTSGQSFRQVIPLNQVFAMTNAGEYSIQVWRDTYDKAVSAGPLKIRLVPALSK